MSAHTRSWAKAEIKPRELEREFEENASANRTVTVETTVCAYLEDQRSRHLSRATLAQSRAFLLDDFLAWCKRYRPNHLNQVRLGQLREFRQSWQIGAGTAVRRHERLRALFSFSISNGWMQHNPMNGLKKPITRQRVTN